MNEVGQPSHAPAVQCAGRDIVYPSEPDVSDTDMCITGQTVPTIPSSGGQTRLNPRPG